MNMGKKTEIGRGLHEVPLTAPWSPPNDEFLQSPAYGMFLSHASRSVVRFVYTEKNSTETLQAIVLRTRFGRYLYIPRATCSLGFWRSLRVWCKKQHMVFVRFDPGPIQIDRALFREEKTHELGSQQVDHTWLLDMKPPLETLLKRMHPKTRYNIRLAEKKGVIVDREKDPELFWNLRKVTLERNAFSSHSKPYYLALYELPELYQLNARLDGKPIATGLFLKCGKTLTYIHGGSANEDRNSMAAFLLQYEAMKLAKELKVRVYDWWGTARPAGQKESGEHIHHHHGFRWDSRHEWSGVARFKAGFGGTPVSYPGCTDVLLVPLRYRLYQLATRFRHLHI